jgi:hypothetical protein
MVYSAFGLAAIGIGAGLAFRWKVLLPIIVLLPLAAIWFSVSRGFSFKDTAVVVVVAEGMLQGGYFVGLLIGFLVASLRSRGTLSFFKTRPNSDERANDPKLLRRPGLAKHPNCLDK